MKKFYPLLTILLILTATVANAQFVPFKAGKVNNPRRCATYEIMQEARKNNPNAETDQQFEAWVNNMTAKRKAQGKTNTNFTLPIVFHVIHGGQAIGTSPNLDAGFIKAQVLQLNQAYGNIAGSPYPAAASTGIQLAMAEKNPSGVTLAEPGIDRISYTTKGWNAPGTAGWSSSYIDNTVKPGSVWDASKYINIWVVPSMQNGILGYATFPTSSGLSGLSGTESANTAGVVILTSSVGSNYKKSSCGTDPYNAGATLTHELGHFFGLRHIWGDAACGTDYVGDTPTAEDANYGLPTHPKANACGTADEMFENYMDYTDDAIMNTFTQGQVDRIQTVMQNSPRRNTLNGSTAGIIPAAGTNQVAFTDFCGDTLTVSETGITGTGVKYRDIKLKLTVEDRATDAASLTFSPTGSAINGLDYEILTPTLDFVTGEATKEVVIRILDDVAVDGEKKIVLNYTIAGSGVSAGSLHQNITITIVDDDNIKIGQNPVALFQENFEGALNSQKLPVGWRYLSTSGYANRFVVSANGNATSGTTGNGNCLHITNNSTSTPNTYSRGTSGIGVAQTSVIDPAGYQSIGNISYKYKIRGRGTLSSPIDYGILTYTVGGQTTAFLDYSGTPSLTGAGPYCTNSTTPIANTVTVAPPAGLADDKFALSFWFETGTSTTGGDPGLNIDDVVLMAKPFPIETAVSNSFSYKVPALVNNNFRSANKRQIISISGANADVDGVVAAVTEAGNDQPFVTTDDGNFMRSRKVVTVSAPNAGNTSYIATIYFTDAEIAAWGANASSVKIMRVDEGVSLSSQLNSANAEIVTPTITDKLATEGYIAYTASFSKTGQFTIVENATSLPLKLISFNGDLKNNSVNLKWITNNETNTKGFEVERSTQGVDFRSIGFVKGLNRTENVYGLNDASIVKGNRYYYRLKMIDEDGKFSYSNIVTIAYMDKDKWFYVYPNPVKDILVIKNNNGATQKAEIVISEVSGRIVYQSNESVQGKVEVATHSWSSGTYFVKIKSNGIESVLKVVKQ